MTRIPQASAIPYRIRSGAPEYLLVTTQKGNWIFPKGIIEDGETAEAAALKEAFEEAGARGRIQGAAIGRYAYEKWDSVCDVAVFLLDVEALDEVWLEQGERERAWFSFDEAREAVKGKRLRAVLERAQAILAGSTPPRSAGSSGPGT